jgi:replicative DNA helicase
METNLRIPPHSEESERGALGSILLEPQKALDKCLSAGLREEMFYDRRHQALFSGIMEMNAQNKPIDAITIMEHLSASGELEKVGGHDYLLKLQDSVIVAAHCEFYTQSIAESYRRRKIIESASEVIESAYKDGDTSKALADIQSIGTESTAKRTRKQVIADAKEMSTKMNEGRYMGIPTPFYTFNRDTYGIDRGIVCPLAGRGGKGKSMLKAMMTAHCITHGIPVFDMCFEDNDAKTAMRISACMGGYDLFRLKRGNVSDEYMKMHTGTLDRLQGLPYFPHQEACTVEDAAIHIGRFVRENEPEIRANGGLVFVDGIKDMIPSGGENKTGQEEHISAGLSRIAVKHRDISIVPITHLTKLDTESWITLNNIRGSALQVANGRAAMLFQDAGFDNDMLSKADHDADDLVCLEMAKSNFGEEGRILLRKRFDIGRFEELTEADTGFKGE